MRATIYGIVAALGIVCLSSVADARDSVYFFHNDHLGTPQTMTDLAGRTVWQAEYEPFGKAIVDEDPDGDGQLVVNNLRFPGQYFDAETGLHYNYHRDYDPGTGRYLQPDPIGLYGGMNLYSYVQNDPMNLMDPDGLSVIGKVLPKIIKLVKGRVAVKAISADDAVRLAKEGEEFIMCSTKKTAREAARRDGKASPIFEVDRKTGAPHYHPAGRSGSHFLYGIAGALTLSHYAEGNGSMVEGAAFIGDLFNPLSLPQDILDIKDALSE